MREMYEDYRDSLLDSQKWVVNAIADLNKEGAILDKETRALIAQLMSYGIELNERINTVIRKIEKLDGLLERA